MEYIRSSLKDCIADFEVLVDSKQDASNKLHENLVVNLEKKLKDLAKYNMTTGKGMKIYSPPYKINITLRP